MRGFAAWYDVRVRLAWAALMMALLLSAGCGGCSRGSAAPTPAGAGSSSTHLDPIEGISLDTSPIDWSRPVPQSPPGGVAQPGYVGSDACHDCHTTEFASYARHSMARTGPRPLSALDPKWLAKVFDEGAGHPVLHERSGFSYRPFRRGTDYFVEELVLANDGSRVQSRIEPLSRAYSAGSYGMTFYVRQGPRLYQIPIDYYPQAGRWGLDPAAVDSNPRFSKPLGSFCISCHADYPKRRAGTDSVFVDPLPTGIGCERCHGPGEAHVRSGRAEDIVNPARLPASRQLDVCVQCHESSHSILRAGRDEFSYRPGEPACAYRINFVDDPPAADRFILLGHPERMVRSACFRQSGGRLTCTSCHDPHRSSFDQPESWWDQKCQACHADRPCTETAEARAAMGDHCVPCHMRKGPPISPTLVTITDHWIQRRPPPIRDAADAPSRLVAWSDLVKDPTRGDDLPLAEALAYASAGRTEEAERIVATVHGDGLRAPRLYDLVAQHYERSHDVRSASRALATLLHLDPDARGPLLSYARSMLEQGPDGVPEATRALDRLLALDPDDADALETKAITLFRAGRVDDAHPLFARAAQVALDAGPAHVALAAIARHEGKASEAIAELEAARAIEPADAWILDRLHDAYQSKGDPVHVAEVEAARKYFSSKSALGATSATRWLPDAWR